MREIILSESEREKDKGMQSKEKYLKKRKIWIKKCRRRMLERGTRKKQIAREKIISS